MWSLKQVSFFIFFISSKTDQTVFTFLPSLHRASFTISIYQVLLSMYQSRFCDWGNIGLSKFMILSINIPILHVGIPWILASSSFLNPKSTMSSLIMFMFWMMYFESRQLSWRYLKSKWLFTLSIWVSLLFQSLRLSLISDSYSKYFLCLSANFLYSCFYSAI